MCLNTAPGPVHGCEVSVHQAAVSAKGMGAPARSVHLVVAGACIAMSSEYKNGGVASAACLIGTAAHHHLVLRYAVRRMGS
jgi:hypothetical protein